jgi:hypothetical protein
MQALNNHIDEGLYLLYQAILILCFGQRRPDWFARFSAKQNRQHDRGHVAIVSNAP